MRPANGRLPRQRGSVLEDSERLLLTVFHRRTETVADIAVMASHAFMVLDREVQEEVPSHAITLRLLHYMPRARLMPRISSGKARHGGALPEHHRGKKYPAM